MPARVRNETFTWRIAPQDRTSATRSYLRYYGIFIQLSVYCKAMSTTRKIDKWLLVQWKSGGRGVVNSNEVGTQREPKVGTVVNVSGPEGERQTGTVIGNSRKYLFNRLCYIYNRKHGQIY